MKLTKDITAIDHLPDVAVLTAKQACALTNLSIDTFRRLRRNGEAPPRVQLSKQRIGYPLGGLRGWLKARTV